MGLPRHPLNPSRHTRAAATDAAVRAGGEVQASVSVGYGHTFFGFLPIENVFGSAELNS
jgi:hypothetical protein